MFSLISPDFIIHLNNNTAQWSLDVLLSASLAENTFSVANWLSTTQPLFNSFSPTTSLINELFTLESFGGELIDNVFLNSLFSLRDSAEATTVDVVSVPSTKKKSGFVFDPSTVDISFLDTIRAAPHPSTLATIDPIDITTATPEEIEKHRIATLELEIERALSYDITESLKEQAEVPVNTTNVVMNKGKEVNLAKLSNRQLYDLVYETDNLDDLDAIQNTETIRSMYHHSIPTTKLQYPEPFLASPSLIHNDLGFLHILQYQFWLWFVFIFLIVFFFISFLCVVRWCNVRTRPRRETRGVSRSKCGDLITATVPVTWAASIIVSESTDATDYYDGFGTSEIIIGVRAYQWGWQYYYPKNIDLQYNVKPSYSTFIGNSLKYNTVSGNTLNRNNLWRTYQNKSADQVITPAHLLALPTDNAKVLNFMNFRNIGSAPTQAAQAFKKIRGFSKVYTTNLSYVPTNLTGKYVQLNKLYLDNNSFNNSFSYGTRRQHNLTSSRALTSNYSSFLDNNSRERFLSYTLNLQTNLYGSHLKTEGYSNLLKSDTFKTNNLTSATLKTISGLATTLPAKTLNPLAHYPVLANTLNDNSDKKILVHPFRKLLNSKLTTVKLLNNLQTWNASSLNNTLSSTASGFTANHFGNTNTTTKSFNLSSPNQRVLPSDRTVRQFVNADPRASNFNLDPDLNVISSNLRALEASNVAGLNQNYYSLQKSSWVNNSTFTNLAGNRLFLDASYPAVLSNNPIMRGKDFDSTRSITRTITPVNTTTTINDRLKGVKGRDGVAPLMLGAGAQMLPTITKAYWSMFWAHSNPDARLKSLITANLFNSNFYLPSFTTYADYDFLNEQANDLLEDAYWETSFSSYDYFDYLNIHDAFHKDKPKDVILEVTVPTFPRLNLYTKLKPLDTYIAADKEPEVTGESYPAVLHTKSALFDVSSMRTQDFNLVTVEREVLDDIVDTYASFNSDINVFGNQVLKTTRTVNSLYPRTISTGDVLNSFGPNYSSALADADFSTTDSSNLPLTDELTLNGGKDFHGQTARLSNPFSLRTAAKNSIQTHAAYDKVFKVRFDESRSHVNSESFSGLSESQPFVMSARVPYEKLIGKNKESFYSPTFYSTETKPLFNAETSLANLSNFPFYDFPFTLSKESDMTRYVWFDWYTRWGKLEIQPASNVRLSSLGVPYSKKHFDYSEGDGDEIKRVESYFTRMSRTRKNYLPNWTYTPYLFARTQIWNNNQKFFDLWSSDEGTSSSARYTLSLAKQQWKNVALFNTTTSHFTPSVSGDSIYSKNSWRPYTSAHAYYYSTSHLADLLTKREYLYRQYFELNNKVLNLPAALTSNPNNPLIEELKATFLFIDPINYTTEYSRDFYYGSLEFFKFLLFKDWLLWLNQTTNNLPINSSALTNYLFFYFLQTPGDDKLGNNEELYKNQYRPMRKGINNMLRLQGSGAIAMPTEIRLRILASSKDVIHSWAIPSAGVKIDCIPGYTSHRIMIFLNSGIYWGQCMEICGRYHHWMPIIIYFMKRDLFFLWCTHFAFQPEVGNVWTMNDRQYSDYIRFASYDKNSWLSELSRSL